MTDEELQPCLDNKDNSYEREKRRAEHERYDDHSPEDYDIVQRFSLLKLIEKTGNVRSKLIIYLCMHRDSNNLIVKTQEQISRESGISFRTVKKELNSLTKEGMIKKKYGSVMINPRFIIKGGIEKRHYLIKRYNAFC